MVIAGVALVTAGAVAVFSTEPSEGAPGAKSLIIAETPIEVASLDPLILPVHKVVTTPVSVSVRSSRPVQPEPKQEAVAKAAEAEAAATADALKEQDPRWARADEEQGTTAFASILQPTDDSADGNGIVATGAIPLVDPSPSATKTIDSADETETAAIAPDQVKPKRVAKKPKKPAETSGDDNAATPPGLKAPTRTVQLGKGVNMRSRPKSGSSVLTVIPKGAAVDLIGCKAWCEVVYKNRRGYIYKAFVGASSGAQTKKASKTKTVFTVDAKPPEPVAPTKPVVKPVLEVKSNR